jgi:hypothetical protein
MATREKGSLNLLLAEQMSEANQPEGSRSKPIVTAWLVTKIFSIYGTF